MKLYKTGDDWGDFVIFEGTASECDNVDVDATSKKMDCEFLQLLENCCDPTDEQIIWESLVSESDFYERNYVFKK